MREALRVVFLQLLIGVLLMALAAAIRGSQAALGIASGTVILASGALIYAWIALRNPYRPPVVIVRLHLIAEATKLFWSILLFLLLILWQPGMGLWCLVGYAVPAMTYWLALFYKPKQQ